MGVKIKYTCPLGHQCEKVNGDYLERCVWYTEIEGKNPQNEERIKEWKCAIAWLPLLNVEMSGTNRGQTAAIESFRNETVKRQEAFLGLAKVAAQKRLNND